MPVQYLFIDMNAYFASVEQHDRPELRGRPVAVIPVEAETTACIAASYEAKRFGVRTGTRVSDARTLCPKIVFVKARPRRYIAVHHQIIEAVETVLPVDAVCSIDEMICKLMGDERTTEKAVALAQQMKQAIADRVGETLRCSVGLASNRMLAKLASDMQKPDGLTVIEKADLPQRLYPLKLQDFPGVGPRMERRLLKGGVGSVEQFCAQTKAQLSRIWGSKLLGEMWWYKLQGDDLPESPTRRRTMGHSHVLPPHLRNERGAHAVLLRLIDKVAARMRFGGYWAGTVTLSVSHYRSERWSVRRTIELCQDTRTLVNISMDLWKHRPELIPVKVGVVLSDLVHQRNVTPSLFDHDRRDVSLAHAMDRIREKFGTRSLFFSAMQSAMDEIDNPIAFNQIPDLRVPGM